MAEKSKGGRPAHRPTKARRTTARLMAACRIPQTEIAREIGIDKNTLRKHYAEDLAAGPTSADFKVLMAVYYSATRAPNPSVAACRTWIEKIMGMEPATGREDDPIHHVHHADEQSILNVLTVDEINTLRSAQWIIADARRRLAEGDAGGHGEVGG